jgi:heat shock protein HslJ
MASLRLSIVLAAALLLVGGCGAGSDGGSPGGQPEVEKEPASAIGTLWHWNGSTAGTGDVEVVEPHRYTLLLRDDGGAEFRFDCNRGRGSYEMEGERLRFGPIMTTRMACPEDSQDFVFGQQLDGVESFLLDDGQLRLRLQDGGSMRFRPEAG